MKWLTLLVGRGPKYEYFSEPDESFMFVNPENDAKIKEFFSVSGVKVMTGHRYLNSLPGDQKTKPDLVTNKVY